MALPRVAEILLPIIREAVPSAQVATVMPEVSHKDYPLILVRRVGGVAINMDLLDRVTVDIQVFHNGTMAEAEDIALAVRGSLWSAYRKQRVIAGKGHIGYFTEMSGPGSVASDIPGVWRYQALYSVRIRPAS